MGKLSTHVLDTYHGRPAAGVTLRLSRVSDGRADLVRSATTNADGRTDAPLLVDAEVQKGLWRLEFDVADYYRAKGLTLADPPFVGTVQLDFGISEDGGSYHVPLVCTPWSWSTYRGS